MTAEEREYADFVPVMVARSAEDAEKYCELLNDHDIPAAVAEEKIDQDGQDAPKAVRDKGSSRGVPVLVPEEFIDEAGEIIADHEDADEYLADSDEIADEIDDEDDVKFGFGEELSDEQLGGDDDADSFLNPDGDEESEDEE